MKMAGLSKCIKFILINMDSVQMIVDEMNILTTKFLRGDGEKIYYPNSELASKPISNVYFQPRTEVVEFAISVRTPAETLEMLQQEIGR